MLGTGNELVGSMLLAFISLLAVCISADSQFGQVLSPLAEIHTFGLRQHAKYAGLVELCMPCAGRMGSGGFRWKCAADLPGRRYVHISAEHLNEARMRTSWIYSAYVVGKNGSREWPHKPLDQRCLILKISYSALLYV